MITWLVAWWIVLPLCPLSIQLQYWLKYSVSSTKISGLFWWTSMRPEFIVGDGKLWLRSAWIFSSYSSVIVFSFVSSNNSSCSTSASSMFCSCVSIRWIYSWVFSTGLIWSYGFSKRTEFNFCWWWSILDIWGAVLDVSVILFKSLGNDPFF